MEPLNKSIGLEIADDILDVLDQLAPDAEDDAVIPRESCFRENYRQGCFLHVHVVWGAGDGQGNAKALCARYEWLLDDLGGPVGHPALGHEPWIEYEDGAVFVDVVEFTQDPERVRLWGKGLSLVWLRGLDRCELLRPELVPQVLDASRLLLEPVLFGEDGKIDLAKNRDVVRHRLHHFVRDVIQAGAQLVDGVSEGEAALSRWCQDMGWGGTRWPLKLVVNNGRLTGVYTGTPTKQNVLEVTEVFLAPLDLRLGRVK